MKKHVRQVIFLLWTILLSGCSDNDLPPPPPVVVSKPVPADVTSYLTETGNTVAYNSVDLVARVEGYLEKISFTDGTFVQEGSPLFVIQPEPYMAKLEEAEASLAREQAQYLYAEAEYQRQVRMFKQNATSQSDVQKWLAQRDQAKAGIDQAKANVEIAKINYGYTHIAAPFTGKIGRHLVDVDNLVGNGAATKLATIEQIDPMYVYFNVNELDILKIRRIARANGFKPEDIKTIPVSVALQDEEDYPHKGYLDFANTGLDASTGTIQLRALLPNKDKVLVPGLFVKVRIALGKPSRQLTVPAESVQYDQIGAYLLVVGKDDIVVQKRIETGTNQDGMVAVKGLEDDDKVVVNGLQNANPGSKVTITEPVPAEKDKSQKDKP